MVFLLWTRHHRGLCLEDLGDMHKQHSRVPLHSCGLRLQPQGRQTTNLRTGRIWWVSKGRAVRMEENREQSGMASCSPHLQAHLILIYEPRGSSHTEATSFRKPFLERGCQVFSIPVWSSGPRSFCPSFSCTCVGLTSCSLTFIPWSPHCSARHLHVYPNRSSQYNQSALSKDKEWRCSLPRVSW